MNTIIRSIFNRSPFLKRPGLQAASVAHCDLSVAKLQLLDPQQTALYPPKHLPTNWHANNLELYGHSEQRALYGCHIYNKGCNFYTNWNKAAAYVEVRVNIVKKL